MGDPAAVPAVRAGPVRITSPFVVQPPIRTGYDVDAAANPGQPVTLADLVDVDATGTGALFRDAAGGTATFRALSHHHDQPVAVFTWLIAHGLPFTPAGVEVTGTAGQRIYPREVVHTPGQTRLEFSTPVAGTADLS